MRRDKGTLFKSVYGIHESSVSALAPFSLGGKGSKFLIEAHKTQPTHEEQQTTKIKGISLL